ncbi:uracil-DNA glycosylase [Zoogloea dura]|uniref:Type-4 uracil-DNA glycosylase n=1 Tax=Zoogloea dura TaxID=2728840 RepID=A0A848FXL0_9RHOO|nr:uracil-DNA glycosylase [Zoogloea dura]NML24677.1 uracil-DNA glycosylase [Zoogloea dura]
MTPRRDSILREMGLAPLWRLRSREVQAADEQPAEPVAVEPLAAQAPVVVATVRREPESRSVPRNLPTPPLPRSESAVPHSPEPLPRVQPAGDLGNLGWDDLETRIRGCEGCVLCKRRKQAVPGVGDREADWLFVGEGPGAEEDERGEPFVGQAGRLLDTMLAAIDLRRGDDVYIANAVKCRPPNNRTPDAAELAACFPYLQRQIELVRPRLIVALGRPAAQALLNEEVRIAASRGKLFSYKGIPVVITYHPAYLLRNLADKAKAWEDLCFARARMAELRNAS